MEAMTSEEYMTQTGLLCPNCRESAGVHEGDPETDGNGGIALNCWCTRCKAEWTEEYKLVGYGHLEVK